MSSQPLEVLLSVTREDRRRLGAQIEDQLRDAIRSGALRPGTRVPSTRDLARQLGVSRPVVMDAYAQLGAEGYLVISQGARPRVSDAAAVVRVNETAPESRRRPRFDFRPSVPDLSAFPRAAWLRALREALGQMADAELDYGDVRGTDALRLALSEYLGRVRGVVALPARVIVTTGYAQGRGLVCRALVAAGAKRIAIEDPSHPEQRATMTRAGLELVPIPVDHDGVRVDALAAAGVDAVVLTPAHQYPTGAVLSGPRRAALLDWLRRSDAIAIEDDYDAEYRYDRSPVGALQGLAPDHVVYAGTVSKTLAPALRLGWLAVPERLVEAVVEEKRLADLGTSHIEQHALARFLARGDLDRHLRRMRARYRRRRDTLVESLARALPEAEVQGIAAGLHATVRLADSDDERVIVREARRRDVELVGMTDYLVDAAGPPTVLLGYAHSPEPTIRAGVLALGAAVLATRGP